MQVPLQWRFGTYKVSEVKRDQYHALLSKHRSQFTIDDPFGSQVISFLRKEADLANEMATFFYNDHLVKDGKRIFAPEDKIMATKNGDVQIYKADVDVESIGPDDEPCNLKTDKASRERIMNGTVFRLVKVNKLYKHLKNNICINFIAFR